MTKPRPEEWPIEKPKAGFNAREDLDLTPEFLESIKANGVQSPIWVTESGRIIAGNRRLAAAKQVGHKTIPVLVYPDLPEGELVALGLLENLARKDLSDYDRFVGFTTLDGMGVKGKDIAAKSGVSAAAVSQVLALTKLCPEAMEAFKAGKLGVTKAYKVVTSPEPLATLALFLNGETREAVGRKTRKARGAGGATAVRVPALNVTLANDIKVVIKGDVDLDSSIDALKDAIKAITKARDTGLNAATAQKVWAEMARAGA